jgi:hypothetical protein
VGHAAIPEGIISSDGVCRRPLPLIVAHALLDFISLAAFR